MLWNNSHMTHLYYDKDMAVENEPCQVRIGNGEILVEYDEEDHKGISRLVQYKGKQEGEGHYVLTCDADNGKATLHAFPGGTVLEGSWVESSVRGMWRIFLKE